MPVKRYDITDNGVEVFSDGHYVCYSEYRLIDGDRNRLSKELTELLIINQSLYEEIETLRIIRDAIVNEHKALLASRSILIQNWDVR